MKALIQHVMKVSGLQASAPPASGDNYTWVERHYMCLNDVLFSNGSDLFKIYINYWFDGGHLKF